ncbi:MAG: hypothetical protein RIC06_04155 [Cyclobacteriaceae bacterium]
MIRYSEHRYETLIAREIDLIDQGKVYGAHFAWSHLWWVFAYPLAGWLGKNIWDQNFTLSSLIAFRLLGLILLFHTLNKVKSDRLID